VTFLVMHLTGLMGMPRRVWTYPDIGWTLPNQISTAGAFLIASGIGVLVIDLLRNFRFDPENNIGNIYGAGTLEWLPSGLYSNRSIPVVKSRYPLWDDASLARDVEEGRYFLPNSVTGERETIVTSPINAEPQYLQRMPGPSWFHFGAAVFTAGFFLLLTVQLYWLSVASGLAAIACILRWVWANDLPMKQPSADIGAGIEVPTYSGGPRGHAWWAMVVLLTVSGMIFLMLLFSYVFLWSHRPELWPAPPALQTFWICSALCVAAIIAGDTARRIYQRSTRAALICAASGAGALCASWLVSFNDWRTMGVDPQLTSHNALVATFLAWDSLFAVIVLLMALYLAVRLVFGLLVKARPATMESVSLFTTYTGAQALIALVITRLFPLAV
jgi:cytochrome c oxidase subunit I+III